MAAEGFAGLRVLSLESRRAQEMAKLIANFGGQPTVAPSMREVPLESNTEALVFAASLLEDRLDMVIFLTGVGARTLARIVETTYSREQFVAALKRVEVVARGPKPVAVLRELGVPISLIVPEPNTWRELLQALDAEKVTLPLEGRQVAVQEYGESNIELLRGLALRGAAVTTVPVYQWALPEDTGPLREAAGALARGEVDVMLLTSSAQLRFLLQVAAGMGVQEQVQAALSRVLIASIGPVTTEELKEHGIHADLEPSHPKMGVLVQETAVRSGELLEKKRAIHH
jgi:uroporphyrinogen-III synthase